MEYQLNYSPGLKKTKSKNFSGNNNTSLLQRENKEKEMRKTSIIKTLKNKVEDSNQHNNNCPSKNKTECENLNVYPLSRKLNFENRQILNNKIFPSSNGFNRNRNVSSHKKLSEKDTNVKTETSLFDKKDVTNNTNKQNDINYSAFKNVETDESRVVTGNNVLLTYNTQLQLTNENESLEHIKVIPDVSLDKKDSVIKKLNSKISDLERKLKNMEELIHNNIINNTNTNIMTTEGTYEGYNTQMTTEANNNTNKMILSMNLKNNNHLRKSSKIPLNRSMKEKSGSRSQPKSKLYSSTIKRPSANKNKLTINKNLFPNVDLYTLKDRLCIINLNKSVKTKKITSLTSKTSPTAKNGVNLNLFKPLQYSSKNQSYFNVYNFRSSVDNSKNNFTTANKTSVKTSFDSRGKTTNKSISKLTSGNKSLNQSPKNKLNRRQFLMKEIKKNDCNISLELEPPVENEYQEENFSANEHYLQQFGQIKYRTQNLLTKLTQNLLKRDKNLQSNSHFY